MKFEKIEKSCLCKVKKLQLFNLLNEIKYENKPLHNDNNNDSSPHFFYYLKENIQQRKVRD